MDFGVNSELLNEANTTCSNIADEIDSVLEKIYTGIENLHDSWSGDSYTAFKESCENYQDQLKVLTTFIREYGKLLGEEKGAAGEPYENLESAIVNALSMENSTVTATVTSGTTNSVSKSSGVGSTLSAAAHNYYYGDDDSAVELKDDGIDSPLKSGKATVNGEEYTAYFDGDGNVQYYVDSEGNYYNSNDNELTQEAVNEINENFKEKAAKTLVTGTEEYKGDNGSNENVELSVGDTATFTDTLGNSGEYTYSGYSEQYKQDIFKNENNDLYLLNSDGKMQKAIETTSPYYNNVERSLKNSDITVSNDAISGDISSLNDNSSNIVKLNVGDTYSFVDSDTGVKGDYTYSGYWRQGERCFYKDKDNNLCILDDNGKMKKTIAVNSQYYSGISNSLSKDIANVDSSGDVVSDGVVD